ncbi:cell wall-active antibiotics response protein LiaF [Virgibacillus salexigens]|uniref:Putative membrane protein n=1 Tax=Virgibacillus massiliensis TaxID=1462526 RepID=A0A024Q9A5_9BACI|nr:cell wall-active antibiotics response protein LiaF [Virgibacillus massiliensis]CDQ39123.1 putative membrane protein [Virgibacillus massiliensis]
MFRQLTTDTLNWILIIGVILFIIELTFYHGGMLINALFFSLLIYIGRKKYHSLFGKVIFWVGVVGIVFAILNMLAIRFLIIAAIILFLIHYSKSKKESAYLHPKEFKQREETNETIIRKQPLFDHKLFDDQRTEEPSYQWKDVNIHGAFGDRIIDLSNTVLPNDTAIISIRHMVGNIEIYVPYDVEVSIHHSSLFGRALIFGHFHEKLMNKTLLYQTENYNTKFPRVKVITSLLSGDIEVKRI